MQNQPFAEFSTSSFETPERGDSSQFRIVLLGILLTCIAVVIGIRVCYVQMILADRFITPWGNTVLQHESLSARNGRILSRDGAVLAYDETRYDIAVDYRWMETPFDSMWLRKQVYARLSPLERGNAESRKQIESELEKTRKDLFERLSQLTELTTEELQGRASRVQRRIEKMVHAVDARRAAAVSQSDPQPLDLEQGLSGIYANIKNELTTPPRRYADDPIILKEELEPHLLIHNVPLQVVAAIQSTPQRFPGVHVQSHAARVYPLDNVATHVIGLRKPAISQSGTPQKGTPQKSLALSQGQGGVEEQYQTRLAGIAGNRIECINRRGEIVTSELGQNPQDGTDLILSIDSRLQRTAESLLDESLTDATAETIPVGGVVIVMDLWTGDLLAVAAAPRFSLATMLQPNSKELQQLIDHPQQPFFPRATHMALPPGSVFKIVTAAAALEQGVLTPDDVLECRGYLNTPQSHRCMIFKNYGLGHGEIHLQDALCQSCNVFFYDLAQRIGPDSLLDWSSRFGFGQLTGIDLPGEQAGVLPRLVSSSQSRNRSSSTSLQLAIGQGAMLATPLQVTRMMGAIGNGGYLVTPRIVLNPEEGTEEADRSLKKIPGLSERTLTAIRLGMEMVVHHPRGTGIAALTPSMTIAAKTGTAEVAGRPDHAWFAGYAPVDFPRIAFCVVLEHGGSGGAAGPIVKKLMTEMLGLGLLQPQWKENSTHFPKNTSETVVRTGTSLGD